MSLQTTWPAVQALLQQRLSIIPVRDKQQGDLPAKTPYKGWKQYQTTRITESDLFSDMDRFDTTAVAIICGVVSGNLELIDIDVKYKPGIDAILLSDLRTLYPDIFRRLRIHKTPSGGYHILYRIQDPPREFPGNHKLAGRPSTPEELAAAPKTKTRNFIETRGEGGYALAPPSMGYTVSQDEPIPTLTWAERCSIITLCKMYTELSDTAAPHKPSQREQEYYSTNPFEHFNNSEAGAQVLEANGWKQAGHNSKFIWYTRPGKDKGISASFNLSKRVYFIFTSSTDFDESKGYNPATVLSILQHGGDRKRTYAHLVQLGYGIIRQDVEQRMAKKQAAAGRPLPANASPEAVAEYDTTRALLQSTYPYGIFWQTDDEGKMRISREHLYRVATGLGYRVHDNEPVHISGYTVSKVDPRHLWDNLRDYVKEDEADDILNALEAFIEAHGKYTISRLQPFDTSQLVRDTSHTAYKFYQNGYLFITPQEYSFNTYDTLSGLIWADDVLPRNFHHGPAAGRYVEFLQHAIGDTDAARSAIGYLAHQYKDETTGYIITLTEQCPDPKQGGGSGKNVFCSLLGLTTSFKSIPGSQVKFDEKFLNAWDGERVLALSDVPKGFDFGFLKELTTGAGVLKKLFKDEITVQAADMPKFIVQTNYSYTVTDGGLKRRIIPIEFTDFFTRCGGVDVHFGCHFPKGWEHMDWVGFDNYIAGAISYWMAGGLKLHPKPLTEGGWLKQFEHSYGQVVAGIINEHFGRWLELGEVTNEIFKSDIDAYFRENNTPIGYRPSMQKITAALKVWCDHYKKQFIADQLKRENGIVVKYKWFGNQDDTPF